MKKVLYGAGLCAALLLIFLPGAASAQSVVPNGDFELQSLGPWQLYGNNSEQWLTNYDVTGDGKTSLCWKRRPGTNAGNGGIKLQVYLTAWKTYYIEADAAFLCSC